MYLSMKKHLLSKSILYVALVKIISAIFEGIVRIIFNNNVKSPDMLDDMKFSLTVYSSIFQILVIAVIFFYSAKQMKHYMGLIPEEDKQEMADLQRNYLGNSLSTLNADSVGILLQLWAMIFIGAELVYDFSSIMYRKFISALIGVLSPDAGDSTFVMLYNMTHGFKYLEILTAILLGVIITGIFLNDNFLKVIATLIAVLFLFSFGLLEMKTFSFLGREIGIVWSSLVYHFTETLGLVLFSLYLQKKYKGL